MRFQKKLAKALTIHIHYYITAFNACQIMSTANHPQVKLSRRQYTRQRSTKLLVCRNMTS